VIGSIRHPDDRKPDLDVLLGGLGRLWTAGVSIDWAALHADAARRRVPLPTYPFERRRFWIDGRADQAPGAASSPAARGAEAAREEAVSSGRYDRPVLQTPYRAPRTEVEEAVADHWRALFGLAEVGADDDFLELGGHSLLATQLVARLRDSFSLDLSVRALFEAPTIATLSETIEALLIEQIESLTGDEGERLVPTLSS